MSQYVWDNVHSSWIVSSKLVISNLEGNKLKTRFKIALTIACITGGLIIAQIAFWLMNIPHTVIFLLGTAILAAIFVAGPWFVWRIWRKEAH